MANTHTSSSVWVRLALYGIPAAALYAGLYRFEALMIEIGRQGHWNFIVPIAIAFAVSYFHGGFTASFWDAIGIKAKEKRLETLFVAVTFAEANEPEAARQIAFGEANVGETTREIAVTEALENR